MDDNEFGEMNNDDQPAKHRLTRRQALTGAGVLACAGLIGGGVGLMRLDHGHHTDTASSPHFSVSGHQPAAPSVKQAGQHAKPVLANPDDITHADLGAAGKGSTGYGTGHPTDAQLAYVNGKSVSAPADLPANRIYVPSVGIYASVIPEGVRRGYQQIPTQLNRVAWSTLTPSVAAGRGTTVIAGHVTYNGVRGPFNTLDQLKPGALVYTTDKRGKVYAWRVTSARQQSKRTNWKWDVSGKRRLMLITCAGPEGRTSAGNGTYIGHLDNLVVIAVPVQIAS